jgi:hypothetical protein
MSKNKIEKLAAKEKTTYCIELNTVFNWGPAPGAIVARALLGNPTDLAGWWRSNSGGLGANAPIEIREEYETVIRKLDLNDLDLLPYPTYVPAGTGQFFRGDSNGEISIIQLPITEISRRLSRL